MLRGLQFTVTALKRSIANELEELSVSFSEAYNVTLKQYHNFIVKGVFSVIFFFNIPLTSPPIDGDEGLSLQG